jgi:hypothetical protein
MTTTTTAVTAVTAATTTDVYYYFFNMSKLECNTLDVHQNYKFPWSKNFDTAFSSSVQPLVIEDLMKRNKWSKKDTILVIPDNKKSPKYIYRKKNMKIERKETTIVQELRKSISVKTDQLINMVTTDEFGNVLDDYYDDSKELNM